jgi:hypothetical protein
MKLDRADAEACGEGLGEIIRRLSRFTPSRSVRDISSYYTFPLPTPPPPTGEREPILARRRPKYLIVRRALHREIAKLQDGGGDWLIDLERDGTAQTEGFLGGVEGEEGEGDGVCAVGEDAGGDGEDDLFAWEVRG